ncbi:MAG TPA: hypothetical protein VFE62_00985 [Gemmataceae bacterium]|nr:hypothetical protein [Gemmataceae bacterium]
MDVHYPPIETAATPEYVLAVLRDAYRQEVGIDDAGASEELFFDTTVEQWCDRWDWYSWQALAAELNRWWKIDCTEEEWRSVLEPADVMCLHDVCNLIARHARRPAIRPTRILGIVSGTAGAFLTVRSLLHEAGARAEEITPSTPLATFTRKYPQVFLGPIAQLAPGVLPRMRVCVRVYDARLIGFTGGLLTAMIATCVGARLLIVGAIFVAIVCYGLTWIAARYLLPVSVEFGALRTFRDLARVLAGSESEFSHQLQ